MKIILQQDVHNVGIAGDTVKVADGYARNFLIPRGMAVLADETNQRRTDHQKRLIAQKQAKFLAQAKDVASRLNEMAVSIRRKAGEDDKLFGSVTNRDIADALAADGLTVDRRTIQLEDPIRDIGIYQVPIKLHRDVVASLKVYVMKED